MADKKQSTVFGLLNNLASMINCTFRGQQTDVQSALNTLDESNVYSDNPIIIGKYIENGIEKPVYRAWIETQMTASLTEVDVSSWNISKVLKITGILYEKKDGASWTSSALPFAYKAGTTNITLDVCYFDGGKKMQFRSPESVHVGANYSVFVIVDFK